MSTGIDCQRKECIFRLQDKAQTIKGFVVLLVILKSVLRYLSTIFGLFQVKLIIEKIIEFPQIYNSLITWLFIRK